MSFPLATVVLAGLVGVPVLLLWTGQRFRTFAPPALGAFRGAIIGYGVACAVVAGILLAPPHTWPPPSTGVQALLATALLVGPGLGAVAGALLSRGDG